MKLLPGLPDLNGEAPAAPGVADLEVQPDAPPIPPQPLDVPITPAPAYQEVADDSELLLVAGA